MKKKNAPSGKWINGREVHPETVTRARIVYPLGDQPEPYEMWGEICQPIWVTYGSLSFTTREGAEHELDNIRRTHLRKHPDDPAKYQHWKVEEYQAHLLKKPYNPFKEKPSKDDEDE